MKLVLLTWLFIPFITFAQLKGEVIFIDDGDTFILLTSEKQQIKIRLYGIDAPEHGQHFGDASKQNLSRLIFGKSVEIINKGLDQFGKTIGVVMIADSNINEIMIRQGYAWHYTHYDQNTIWDEEQQNAQQLKMGLWADSISIEPWNWRHNKNNNH